MQYFVWLCQCFTDERQNQLECGSRFSKLHLYLHTMPFRRGIGSPYWKHMGALSFVMSI